MIRTEQKSPATPAATPQRDIVGEMADAMRRLRFGNGIVTEDALSLEGFTFAEIEKHGRAARDQANIDSVRRLG